MKATDHLTQLTRTIECLEALASMAVCPELATLTTVTLADIGEGIKQALRGQSPALLVPTTCPLVWSDEADGLVAREPEKSDA